MNILVTGANGQLGNEMQRVAKTSSNHYIFTDVAQLDITDREAVLRAVKDNGIQVIVNCAAYTNVDKAEDDRETADLINNKAVENLAIAARENDATLIHISTDYVFKGPAGKTGKPIRWEYTASPSLPEKKASNAPDAGTSSSAPPGSTLLSARTS